MYNKSKLYLIEFILLVILSILLWYRSKTYDRIMAVFLFIMALIKLTEYGFLNGADPNQSARMIYILLWLQIVFYAFSIWFFLQTSMKPKSLYLTNLSLFLFIIFLVIFVTSMFFIFVKKDYFNLYLDQNNHIIWDFGPCHKLIPLYLIGLLILTCILLADFDFKDIVLFLLIVFSILILIYSLDKEKNCIQIWYSFGIFLGFIIWINGYT